MAINFPDNPTAGDLYTSNGTTYKWDGSEWVVYDSYATTPHSMCYIHTL